MVYNYDDIKNSIEYFENKAKERYNKIGKKIYFNCKDFCKLAKNTLQNYNSFDVNGVQNNIGLIGELVVKALLNLKLTANNDKKDFILNHSYFEIKTILKDNATPLTNNNTNIVIVVGNKIGLIKKDIASKIFEKGERITIKKANMLIENNEYINNFNALIKA